MKNVFKSIIKRVSVKLGFIDRYLYAVSVALRYVNNPHLTYEKTEDWSDTLTHDLCVSSTLLFHLNYPAHVKTFCVWYLQKWRTHLKLVEIVLSNPLHFQHHVQRLVSILVLWSRWYQQCYQMDWWYSNLQAWCYLNT